MINTFQSTPHFSFEFFPPQTQEGQTKLSSTAKSLAAFNPEFFSVTFGAGGSIQYRTLEMVQILQQETQVPIAPHISCVSATKENILPLLQKYIDNQVKRLVVLRGDLPSGMGSLGEFKYANELISFIRQETGDHFYIEVAAYPEAHPQSKDAHTDLSYFKQKVEAGANSALTQYFYNPDAYHFFVKQCKQQHINIPIVPGIMPITNYEQLKRFSTMCGAEIPRWIEKNLIAIANDSQAIFEFGVTIITDLCQTLLEQGAPGLHFYTLNNLEAVSAIWKRLDLPNS